MIETDVVIVGAGPAGAACAINLAPLRRVILVDAPPPPGPRIGESVPPAIRLLLSDMALWQGFLAQQHRPRRFDRAIWGGPHPVERDSLLDPDGHGWHLDRQRFDTWLREMAVARNAALVTPAAIGAIAPDACGWSLTLLRAGRAIPLRARLIVDAAGRRAQIARQLGASRVVRDRLICHWRHGQDRGDPVPGETFIEAEPEGWWYTAAQPGSRRVLGFHTDADLGVSRAVRQGEGLLARALQRPGLARLLGQAGFVAEDRVGATAAHTTDLSPAAGDGWLAVGDAALSFDPLSSQGILNALYTGLAGAEAADRYLGGDPGALQEYAAGLLPIRDAYRWHLAAWYGQERRWPDSVFWQRRLSLGQAAATM